MIKWLSQLRRSDWPQAIVRSLGRLAAEVPFTALLVVLVAQVPLLAAGTIVNAEGERVDAGRWEYYGQQVGEYLLGVVRGDVGAASYGFGQVPLTRVLPDLFTSTLTILGPALVLGIAAGVLLGLLAVRSSSAGGRLFGRTVNIFALSIPDFFVVFLLMLLGVQLYRTFGTSVFPIVASVADAYTWVYPLLTLLIFPVAYTSRVTFNAAAAAEKEPFVAVARAKGLSESRITYGHILRRILPDVLASIPSTMVLTVSSLVIVEYLFSYLGLGRYMFTYNQFDTHNLTTIALALLLILVVVRVLSDIGRLLADPRARETAERDDEPLW